MLPAPARASGNYRAYDATHLNRLSFIRRARDLSFSIEQLPELLSLADQKNRTCVAVDAIAREHLSRRELDTIISQCGCGMITECLIIEALSS